MARPPRVPGKTSPVTVSARLTVEGKLAFDKLRGATPQGDFIRRLIAEEQKRRGHQ